MYFLVIFVSLFSFVITLPIWAGENEFSSDDLDEPPPTRFFIFQDNNNFFLPTARWNFKTKTNFKQDNNAIPGSLSEQIRTTANLLTLVNIERNKRSLNPLCANMKLVVSATKQSITMASRGAMEHQFNGSPSLGDRISLTGFQWRTVAENIAMNVFSAASVMQAWMDSPGILLC